MGPQPNNKWWTEKQTQWASRWYEWFLCKQSTKSEKKHSTLQEQSLWQSYPVNEGQKLYYRLECVHPDLISEIIRNMRSSKTCGLDNIDSYVLKLVCEEVTPGISHIVNLSIEKKHFPSLWKNSKVIPLFKKDDPTSPKCYRPVSLLPITSKILERAVYQQLITYLEENNLLHPSHHGFRKNIAQSQLYLKCILTGLKL